LCLATEGPRSIWSEFFFLDDAENPLTLKFRLGIDAIKPMVPEMAA
jgi:hypothetical protein